MKRLDNLFTKICSMENLILAEKKARKGKTRTIGVRLFDKDKEGNLKRLREELLSGTFKTSEYTNFIIYEPKERLISRLPYYPDRIVHHAVMNVLEPIWVSVFIKNTYSCIKNRGIHKAVNDLKGDLRRDVAGTRYCLKIDIKKFYPSIDHDVLKGIIRKKIKDVRLLNLLDEVIDSADGIPIGNYLSQYFANLYLSYFDHKMKEKYGCKYYYRYADDIVVLSDSKEALRGILKAMREELSDLRLTIKDNWQIFPVESRGIDFLGYVFRHTYTKLRKSTKRRLIRKVVRISKMRMSFRKKWQELASYFGWLKYCNSSCLKQHLNTISHEQIFLLNTAISI